jgi:GDSL-like lipase/acylhydrolase family protein
LTFTSTALGDQLSWVASDGANAVPLAASASGLEISALQSATANEVDFSGSDNFGPSGQSGSSVYAVDVSGDSPLRLVPYGEPNALDFFVTGVSSDESRVSGWAQIELSQPSGGVTVGYRGWTVATGAIPPPPPTQQIVGLGDSYSSGEGNDPFDSGTDVFNKKKRLDGCHRSAASWERQIGVTQGDHIACSGAVINNLTAFGQERIGPDNVPQIQRLRSIETSLEATGRHVDDVVLTIGGNDIGFASILGDCFIRECLAHFDKNERDVMNLRRPLADALARIRVAAPSAKVILVGYPRIFPGQQSGNVACGWLTPTERERANTLAADLDVVEHLAANDGGATFVSVTDALDGHELCAADSWVFPISPLVYGTDQRQAHPIYAGQAAIASIVGSHL